MKKLNIQVYEGFPEECTSRDNNNLFIQGDIEYNDGGTKVKSITSIKNNDGDSIISGGKEEYVITIDGLKDIIQDYGTAEQQLNVSGADKTVRVIYEGSAEEFNSCPPNIKAIINLEGGESEDAIIYDVDTSDSAEGTITVKNDVSLTQYASYATIEINNIDGVYVISARIDLDDSLFEIEKSPQ